MQVRMTWRHVHKGASSCLVLGLGYQTGGLRLVFVLVFINLNLNLNLFFVFVFVFVF